MNTAIPSPGPAHWPLLSYLRPERDTWLFVAKTLTALYVTGWLAMRLELPQPSTAMLTTIIVAHRQSGAVLAKAFYRGLGTLAGAAASLLMVAAFPQERGLLLTALSVWIGACVGGATLYRNFSAYAFVLAGYTAAIVVVPVVNDPSRVFDSAVARVIEVLLALLVSGAVSDALFPSRMWDVLRRAAKERFEHLLQSIRVGAGGEMARSDIEAVYLRFVRDSVAFEDLRSSIIFEDPEARARNQQMLQLNQRFMEVSTSFQSLQHFMDRVSRRGYGPVAKGIGTLYGSLAAVLKSAEGSEALRVLIPRLAAYREAIEPQAVALREGIADEQQIQEFEAGRSLLERLTDELSDYLEAAAAATAPLTHISTARIRFSRGTDWLGAGVAAFRATLTMLALGVFWIVSAWSFGASAMIIATVFTGLFATVPNPARAVKSVLLGFAVGICLSACCVFCVLNRMDGYALLVAGTAPFLIVGLPLLMSPSTVGLGTGYCMGFMYLLSVKNTMTFDVVRTFNEMLALSIGLCGVLLAFSLVPTTLGSRRLRQRHIDRLRSQSVLAAEAPLPGLRHRFESSSHDLVHQMMVQEGVSGEETSTLVGWALAVHEAGRALIELRVEASKGEFPAPTTLAVNLAVEAVARFYERPDSGLQERARAALADAIATVGSSTDASRLLPHLYLLRSALLDAESVPFGSSHAA